MRQFLGQTFTGFDDRDSGSLFENLVFEKCVFDNCAISMTFDTRLRSTVRNVQLLGCRVDAPGSVDCARVEDVLIDGLATRDLVICWATVFKHVTLRGRIGRLMASPLPTVNPPAEVAKAFRDANAEYYRKVDWAIDIREAEPVDLSLIGVPGRLVRRDPANTVHISASRLSGRHWRLPGVVGSVCEVAIKSLSHFNIDDLVIVANGTGASRQRQLDAFRILREEGLAEPD